MQVPPEDGLIVKEELFTHLALPLNLLLGESLLEGTLPPPLLLLLLLLTVATEGLLVVQIVEVDLLSID